MILSDLRGMMMTSVPSQLTVEVRVDGADDSELAEFTSQLRDRLMDLDVHSVHRLASGEAPEGARAGGQVEFASLVVQLLAQQPGVLQSVIDSIRSWAGRGRVRTVKITLDGDSIELSDPTTEQQERLVDTWVNRHAGSR